MFRQRYAAVVVEEAFEIAICNRIVGFVTHTYSFIAAWCYLNLSLSPSLSRFSLFTCAGFHSLLLWCLNGMAPIFCLRSDQTISHRHAHARIRKCFRFRTHYRIRRSLCVYHLKIIIKSVGTDNWSVLHLSKPQASSPFSHFEHFPGSRPPSPRPNWTEFCSQTDCSTHNTHLYTEYRRRTFSCHLFYLPSLFVCWSLLPSAPALLRFVCNLFVAVLFAFRLHKFTHCTIFGVTDICQILFSMCLSFPRWLLNMYVHRTHIQPAHCFIQFFQYFN